MARLAWIGGTVLILIITVGIVRCVYGSPECLGSACRELWLHCAWTTVNSTVVVALFAAGFAAVLAWWFQRANKVMELRFATFKEAQALYRDLSNAAWEVFTLRCRIRQSQLRGPDPLESGVMERDLKRSDDALRGALTSAHTLVPINGVLFAPETQAHWGRILTRYQRVAFGDDLWEVEDHLARVANDRVAFIKAAAAEIGLPYAEIALEGTETENLRAEARKILQRIMPRPGPQPGSDNREQ